LSHHLLLLLLGGFAAAWYLCHRTTQGMFKQRRRGAMWALATKLKGAFRETGAVDPGDRVRRLFTPLVSLPLSAIRNVVRVGPLLAFDQLSYGGPLRRRHWRTFVLVETGIDIGRVLLAPEGVKDRFVEEFGLDDIDFESAEFSRRFRVTGERRDLTFALFDTDMMELLLRQRRLWISLASGWALLWPGATWMSLGDIEAFFDFARAFRGSIPRHLREDHPA